jgi:hypothetical protein
MNDNGRFHVRVRLPILKTSLRSLRPSSKVGAIREEHP